MNITFVYPDHESLGIQALMSLAKLHGHNVQLVLYTTGDNFHTNHVKTPRDLLSIFFRNEYVVDICYKKIANQIIDTAPDLIAFSCVTDNFEKQRLLAQACKQINPDIHTVFGGIHVTSLPEHVIAYPEVDIIAIGEADLSFIKLLTQGPHDGSFSVPDKPIKGIVIKKNGKVIGDFVEGDLVDLDSLPIPDKKIWHNNHDLEYMKTDYKLMSSRGCPYRCSFCCNDMLHALRGKSVIRRRSISHVIEELSYVKKYDKGIKTIHFWDDCFTSDKKWLKNFAKEYKNKISLPFQCLAIPQFSDKETVRILADMGCVGVQLGVQSLSPLINKKILSRSFNLNRISIAINSFNSARIKVFADHILGIPEDTIGNQEKALLFYNDIRPFRIHAFWLTYYPGTKIATRALGSGLLSKQRYQEIISGKNCKADLLVTSSKVKGNLKQYLPVAFLLKYIPILPKWLVTFFVKTKLYRLFHIRCYGLSTLLPDYIGTVGGWRFFFRLCIMDINKRLKNAFKNSNNPSKGIIFIEATYGSNCVKNKLFEDFKGNITNYLNDNYQGKKKIHFKVDVNKLGDPAPGRAKDMTITWRYAEDHKMKSYNLYIPAEAHGRHVEIPPYESTK